jgi:hypothetical protein
LDACALERLCLAHDGPPVGVERAGDVGSGHEPVGEGEGLVGGLWEGGTEKGREARGGAYGRAEVPLSAAMLTGGLDGPLGLSETSDDIVSIGESHGRSFLGIRQDIECCTGAVGVL